MIIIVLENIWWPFGAHLCNTKYMVLTALNNNVKFYYNKNNFLPFKDGLITTFFEKMSNCSESDLHNPENTIFYGCKHFESSPFYKIKNFLYYPSNFSNAEEYHQSVLKMLYRPNKQVLEYINSNKTIQKTQNMKYIGLHIRLSDKTSGPNKETEPISLEKYIDKCIQVRTETGISDIVVCCDTVYALEMVIQMNSTLNPPFNIHYNEDETRCQNTWQDSVVERVRTNKMSFEDAYKEYLTCFINFELLLRSEIAVGNFDSGFIFNAVEMRNNGRDINVAEHVPIFSKTRK